MIDVIINDLRTYPVSSLLMLANYYAIPTDIDIEDIYHKIATIHEDKIKKATMPGKRRTK